MKTDFLRILIFSPAFISAFISAFILVTQNARSETPPILPPPAAHREVRENFKGLPNPQEILRAVVGERDSQYITDFSLLYDYDGNLRGFHGRVFAKDSYMDGKAEKTRENRRFYASFFFDMPTLTSGMNGPAVLHSDLGYLFYFRKHYHRNEAGWMETKFEGGFGGGLDTTAFFEAIATGNAQVCFGQDVRKSAWCFKIYADLKPGLNQIKLHSGVSFEFRKTIDALENESIGAHPTRLRIGVGAEWIGHADYYQRRDSNGEAIDPRYSQPFVAPLRLGFEW